MYSTSLILLLLLITLYLTLAQEELESILKRKDVEETTTSSGLTPLTTNIEITTSTTDDTSDSDSEEAAQSMNQDIYNSKDLFKKEPSVTNVTNLVQVKLYCEVDTALCSEVETVLIAAANEFAKVVNLKTRIIFQTSYYSFCVNQCANSTYGWGSPSSQFTLISLNEADSNFIYPQALAKQLAQFTDSSNWANYDVAIDINHDIHMNAANQTGLNTTSIPLQGGFYFGNDTIQDYQIDLEYVILHQMIHGLGMVSSWAPYFSDTTSPFQKLLSGLITPEDSLKIMTPSPHWYVRHATGPAYITGFQPNLIFDKFLYLFISARNQTIWLGEYGFDMQGFCVQDNEAFIVNFMNAFLNNATQSTKAKTIYVSMSMSKTMTFEFSPLSSQSVYYTNAYLNQTYKSMQLMTGVISKQNEGYYRPGISTSHVDDSYMGTPDFLMTHTFVKGKALADLVQEGYSQIPDIEYNVTTTVPTNITTYHNVTVGNHTVLNATLTTEERNVTVQYKYKSPIGPGILRILETIGYSTVLTNTNYSASIIKTTKPDTTCDDTNSNDFQSRSDDSSTTTALSLAQPQSEFSPVFSVFVLLTLIWIIQ
ncbi:hypothetical protein CU098_001236 [Rhizopus stolonifer]|uniref:Uncharacterized protein n=1 Tax=Rhizopus stolonifer TaxID=4846 RepID=A0A367IV98_RHIST|nr:hypothetical protein CU098_001236 [Rhizopus stolonifer]